MIHRRHYRLGPKLTTLLWSNPLLTRNHENLQLPTRHSLAWVLPILSNVCYTHLMFNISVVTKGLCSVYTLANRTQWVLPTLSNVCYTHLLFYISVVKRSFCSVCIFANRTNVDVKFRQSSKDWPVIFLQDFGGQMI